MIGYTKAAFIVDAKTILGWSNEKANSFFELYGEEKSAKLIAQNLKEKEI